MELSKWLCKLELLKSDPVLSLFIVSEHTGKEVTQGVQDLFNVSFTEY